MSSRMVLKHGICLATMLALVLAVVPPPVRPSSSPFGSLPIGRVHRTPGNHLSRSHRPTAVVVSPTERVKALRSESEELRDRAATSSSPAFDVNLVPSRTPHSEFTASVPHRANRPLRC
jgi:hypothetical protein